MTEPGSRARAPAPRIRVSVPSGSSYRSVRLQREAQLACTVSFAAGFAVWGGSVVVGEVDAFGENPDAAVCAVGISQYD